ncbi:MAG: ABC transporter ATP-binding protein [Tissierellia bacterium]|nr:ABC transporter ATP-binding protein [Tissierellia bacterium]
MKNKILEIKDLEVAYGPIKAIKGISMDVYENDVVAILGANGAGKTTTLRTVSGVVNPIAGSILFEGKEISKLTPEKITRLGVVQSPEGRQIFQDLTVLENLKIGAYVLKDKKQIEKNFKQVYELFPILEQRKTQLAQTLSGGEQQMLAIGRALMASPKLLVLDEPSLGLAPLIVKEILNTVRKIADEGVTVLIVEQNAAQTMKIADYAYVLEVGKISMQGKASDLAKDNSLIEAYLGS